MDETNSPPIDERLLSVNFIENDIQFWKNEFLSTDELIMKNALAVILTNLTNAKMWMKKIIYGDL
jgi:hypothetical protein